MIWPGLKALPESAAVAPTAVATVAEFVAVREPATGTFATTASAELAELAPTETRVVATSKQEMTAAHNRTTVLFSWELLTATASLLAHLPYFRVRDG